MGQWTARKIALCYRYVIVHYECVQAKNICVLCDLSVEFFITRSKLKIISLRSKFMTGIPSLVWSPWKRQVARGEKIHMPICFPISSRKRREVCYCF